MSDALVTLADSCARPYPPLGCYGGCQLDDSRSREKRKAALRILQTACDEGEAPACFVLGLAYDQQLGVNGDPEKAMGLLEKACSARIAGACYRLARLYSFRSGNLQANLVRAGELSRKACGAGLREACQPES